MGLTFISHARAGIAAALLSSAVLCLAIRRYKLLIEGTTALVVILAAVALFRPNTITSLTTSVVYKNESSGVFTSRISPWTAALDNIQNHPWFGIGLGTTANGTGPDEDRDAFRSTSDITAENGSSYLTILSGVGILGAIPFVGMLYILIDRTVRTIWAVSRFRTAAHPAFVLAAIMIGGIFHAALEDWLLAPGNYLCIFFWCLAFIFVDLASRRTASISSMI